MRQKWFNEGVGSMSIGSMRREWIDEGYWIDVGWIDEGYWIDVGPDRSRNWINEGARVERNGSMRKAG